MSFESVDAIQQVLKEDVFGYAKDAKKAAGRALGTLVEIVSFYLLKSWGYEKHMAIERRIPEYANADLTHNVEFTLHPSESIASLQFSVDELPFSASKIRKKVDGAVWEQGNLKNNQLLSSANVLKNSCVVYESDDYLAVACLGDRAGDNWNVSVMKLRLHPFAMFECKRVGVEEGVKKGPQTIEKAKQGAYVARTVSSLQKLRMPDGALFGAMGEESEWVLLEPYREALKSVIESHDSKLLRHFVLTVGIVSNHGNWFTSDDHNKELKVLSQSYDWLLFLSDQGLVQFVEDFLLSPDEKYAAARDAFINSYVTKEGKRRDNRFTKVRIDLEADEAIRSYFDSNIGAIESWFNVISPTGMEIDDLKCELNALATKNWGDILR